MARAVSPGQQRPELSEVVAGRYRLTRKLARGGMGEVFAALDQSTGAKVALKRMLPAALEQRSQVVHFMREYHALSELRHPRIIEVYDFGVDRSAPYYTMELLDGQDLRDLSPLPYREACGHLRDVASSLALLHARRLLHRDVSPRNVRRTSDGRCKLLDFGAMMPFGVPANVTGTAPCVPPEALQGAPLDQRSDLYALGALAYCVLTGHHGYSVSEFDELPHAWKLPVVRPRRRVHDIPEALDELVMALMSLDPMKRPASAAEVIDWLSAIGELPADDGAAAARSFLTSSHLWGRDHERGELTRRLARTLTGPGSALLIRGEPGSGKSRMLAEAALIAQTCGLTVVRAVARKQRGAAATLIADLVHGLRQAAPLEAQRASAHKPHVLAQLARATANSASEDATRGDVRSHILAQVTEYFREVARERPLLVTVDDLDRADEFSSALVAALAFQTHSSRLALIASISSREPEDEAFMTAVKGLSITWTLKPLDRHESTLLVASLFGDVPNLERVTDWLYRVAHGNPKLTLELAEHLLNRGVVRYVEGTWVVPSDEITEAVPLGLADALMLRLTGASPLAHSLAEMISVRRGGVSAEHCLALIERPSDEVFLALEELVRSGVLESAGSEYVFAQEDLRKALQRSLSPVRSRQLHELWAQRLLAQRPSTLDSKLEAGWHLVHTEHELHGADLLAKVGPELVQRRIGMAAAIPAIEQALRVYERHRRPESALLRLRAVLMMSSFLFDYRLASRYADKTIEPLYRYAGLADAKRFSPFIGKVWGLRLGMLVASLRWAFNWTRTRGPNVIDALKDFTRSAMGLIGVRGVALDVTGAIAVYERLSVLENTPLGGLSVVYLLAKSITLGLQGREAELHENAQRAIAQLHAGRSPLMTKHEHADLLAGALQLDGVNECYREHSRALSYARQLESIGTPIAISAAQRICVTYYLLRGDRERTQYHRRALDLHAIQGSTTWQVEWFAVPIEGLAGGAWTDLIAMRRALDRLDRLTLEVPSLLPMRDSVRIGYHFRHGEFVQAAALGEAYVAAHAPRTVIGWGPAYAVTALALVESGDPERALLLCDRALASVSDEDRSYFVMYAGLEVAQATALALLGQRERAEQIFQVRLTRLRACGEHVRAFIIHEYRTKVARLLGDRRLLHEALKDMREAALASGNPAVIALADRVTDLRGRQRSSPLPPARPNAEPIAALPVADQTAVTMFLRDCKQPELRAQHALVMLGQYGTSGEGYLYWVVQDSVHLAASLDERVPPDELEQRLTMLLAAAAPEYASLLKLPAANDETHRYRVFRLMSEETAGAECVGLAVLRETETDSALDDVPKSLVAEIGKVLGPGAGFTQEAWIRT